MMAIMVATQLIFQGMVMALLVIPTAAMVLIPVKWITILVGAVSHKIIWELTTTTLVATNRKIIKMARSACEIRTTKS